MLNDPMPPQATQRRAEPPVITLDEPVSIAELLKRSQIMLQNIQKEFLHPGPDVDPKAARAALAAAGPLLKLLLEKAPQMAQSRHALFEDAVVSTIAEVDEVYKTDFLSRLRQKLEHQSIQLAA
jgi:hypothetical protein